MNDSEYWPKWSERSHSTTILLAIVISARSRGVRGLYHAPAALFSRVHVSLLHLPSDLVSVCPCLASPPPPPTLTRSVLLKLRAATSSKECGSTTSSRMGEVTYDIRYIESGRTDRGPDWFFFQWAAPSINGSPENTDERRRGGHTGHVRSSTCGALAHYEARTIELVRRDDTISFSNAFKPLGFWCTVS